jgi:chorismate mutase
MSEDLVFRLRKRAEIRRQIATRKSVAEGKPDRIADLLEEAAGEIEGLRKAMAERLEREFVKGQKAMYGKPIGKCATGECGHDDSSWCEREP